MSKAMDYFEKCFDNIHFAVCSDDPEWCKRELTGPHITVVHNCVQQDFALLVQCDHLIITYGTFGWWAGWLNNGQVDYFDKPYGGKQAFRNEQMLQNYFPEHWHPMGN